MAPPTPRHHRKSDRRVGVFLRLRTTGDPIFDKLDDQKVRTSNPDGSQHKIYTFTHVFDRASQSEVFNGVAKPAIEDFITKGKNGLVFTYGITGSGKTYTMEGTMDQPGLIYRTADFLFNSIAAQQTQLKVIQANRDNTYRVHHDCHIYPKLDQETFWGKPSHVKWQKYFKESGSVSVDPEKYYCVFMTLIELYNKSIFDLFEDLGPQTERKRLEIREDAYGVSYVANAIELEVKTAEDAKELYKRCVKRRKTGATSLNQESSRGHLVLTFKLVHIQKDKHSDHLDENSLAKSQLSLVDLAGSERTKRTGATGGALNEACNINNSLTALRKCIKALREPEYGNYPNYRTCSLTRLFKSYFEGQGNVNMILCVNPTPDDYNENAMAMDFGIQTQDVAVDYATPPKLLKKSVNRPKIMTMPDDPIMSLPDDQYLTAWLQLFQTMSERRKKLTIMFKGAQTEFRQTLVNQMKQFELLKSEIGWYQRNNTNLLKERTQRQEEISKLSRHLAQFVDNSSPIVDSKRSPSPLLESNRSSSPEERKISISPPKTKDVLMTSPTTVAVINPRHNRSLSCSSIQWIHHRPSGTVDTGTVLKPKFKNGRSVKNLRSKDILNKDVTGYSVIHQDADSNGELETSVYKGDILPTICGGKQIILNDIETMTQVSPKSRKRAFSDVHSHQR